MADQDRRYIYPAKGATVRNHAMSMLPVPDEGTEVVWDQQWESWLAFGDIRIETPEQKVKREQAAEEKRLQAAREQREAEKAAREAEREKSKGEQAAEPQAAEGKKGS